MNRMLAIAFTALLTPSMAFAADNFNWVPKEAKGIGFNAGGAKVLPVVHTKIPKLTANRSAFSRRYTLELEKYGINNSGTEATATAKGIAKALKYAKAEKMNYIKFPKGTYLIDVNYPIVFDHTNTIIDFGGATLKAKSSGKQKYEMVKITYGAKHLRLTNGTLKGDLKDHDYAAHKGKSEDCHLLVIESGDELEIDNMIFTGSPGFTVQSTKGMGKLRENGYQAVFMKNVEQGGFDDRGSKITTNQKSRTINPLSLDGFDGEFEFGFIFGYGSYQSIFDRNYQAFFFDDNMKLVHQGQYIQYKKNIIPDGATRVHLEFNQGTVVGVKGLKMCGSLSNLRAPTDVHFHHNAMVGNGSLGFAFCGGQRWIMEDNHFERNGGVNAPHYGIDFEDGWDLMQDVVFRRNTFKDNERGDLVVCAGSELLFEDNVFQKTAYVWGRTHNYTFRNNKFLGGKAGFKSRTGIATIENNLFKDCTMLIEYENKGINDGLGFAKGVKRETPSIKLVNNIIQDVRDISGTYFDLERCKISNAKFVAGKTTQLVRLKNCTVTDSKLEFQANGPKVFVSRKGGKGNLALIGPGQGRQLK